MNGTSRKLWLPSITSALSLIGALGLAIALMVAAATAQATVTQNSTAGHCLGATGGQDNAQVLPSGCNDQP